MKKLMCVLIAAAMLFCFASCGQSGETSKEAESTVSATSSETVSNDASSASESGISGESSAETSSNAVSSVAETSDSRLPLSYKIVALGDSITAGYALDNPETERYTAVATDMLSALYTDVTCANYAVSGHNTTDMLSLLGNGTATELANANTVILCIGANNVLIKAGEVMFPYFAQAGSIITSLVGKLLKGEDTSADLQSIDNIVASLKSELESDEFKAKLETGYKALEEDIPKIIAYIRSVNPNCKIFYGNIYNPYKYFNLNGIGLKNTFDVSAYSNAVVTRLNTIISSLATEYGYTVVDIYTEFENASERPVNAVCDIASASFNGDPHPNKAGHAIIGDKYARILADDIANG